MPVLALIQFPGKRTTRSHEQLERFLSRIDCQTYLREILKRLDVPSAKRLSHDRWGWTHLQQALSRALKRTSHLRHITQRKWRQSLLKRAAQTRRFVLKLPDCRNRSQVLGFWEGMVELSGSTYHVNEVLIVA